MSPAHSDQNAPRLVALFDRLNHTSDLTEAAAVSRRIWETWYESANDEVTALMSQGEKHLLSRQYGIAAGVFSQVIDLDPNFAEGWNRRATVYYLMGEYQRATEDVNATLKLEPRHFGALSGQGMIYMQLGQKELAIEFMERALEVNPHMSGVKKNIRLIKKQIEKEII